MAYFIQQLINGITLGFRTVWTDRIWLYDGLWNYRNDKFCSWRYLLWSEHFVALISFIYLD